MQESIAYISIKSGCSSFVLNITMKKIAFAEGWSAQEET